MVVKISAVAAAGPKISRATIAKGAGVLTILDDDRHYFPPYEAVPVVRQDTLRRHPEVLRALQELAGKISDVDMQRMNYAVDGEHQDVAEVAREFVKRVASAK